LRESEAGGPDPGSAHTTCASRAGPAQNAELFTAILGRRADFAACVGAIRLLSRLLATYHGERVVILLDEYDSPIHAGYTKGYYDEVIAFFRDFLSGGLKDNPHLFKGSGYDVRSNRESGFGRCDVMVLPKTAGRPGVVMELERVEVEADETPEQALAMALEQIRARDYAAELRERGATPIHRVAVVFDGKRAYVRVG
jgi:hypothetical protein